MPLVEGFKVHPWHELGGTFGVYSICLKLREINKSQT
jgi:hypothetical protein